MILAINHVTLTVQDLDVAFDFYRDVLGLKPIAKRHGKSTYFLAGRDWIALVLDTKKDASHAQASYAHLAFSVTPDEFNSTRVRILKSGAKTWQENSSPGESLYFLDPSGNRLEIHSGSWETRLAWLKANPEANVELFD